MRECFVRQLPHGLFSWRYIQPCPSSQIRTHRSLWWANTGPWPRPIWCMLQLWLWVGWVGCRAWRASWRAVQHFGPDVMAREGVSLGKQRWITLSLALGWCIPPKDVYRFRLYRNPAIALNYVFDHELQAYHQRNSRTLGLTPASLTLLQDKQVQSARLAELGVSTTAILACVPRYSHIPLKTWLSPGVVLFCKTRSGSRGLGAFSAWMQDEGVQGQRLDGTELSNLEAVEEAWGELLRMDDALVQPRLCNHPALAPLALENEAITVRFISQRYGNPCLGAFLEIPVALNPATGHPLYVQFSIDTGRVADLLDALYPEVIQAKLPALRAQLKQMGLLPFWSELERQSQQAHSLFPDVFSIAWDWVITPEGPCLLEGNFCWGTAPLQMMSGGLLAREPD